MRVHIQEAERQRARAIEHWEDEEGLPERHWPYVLAMFVAILLCIMTWCMEGYAQNPAFTAMGDNTARYLGPYSCQEPANWDGTVNCKTITDYSGMQYVPARKQFFIFGGAHSATGRTDISVFDTTSLQWSSDYPSTPCDQMTTANWDQVKNSFISTNHPLPRHTYDMLAVTDTEFILLESSVAIGSCITVAKGFPAATLGSIAHYNFGTKTWRWTAPVVPTGGKWERYAASEVDPVSGKILVLSQYGFWVYDPATGVDPPKLKAYASAAMGFAQNLVYAAVTDKFYYITNGGLVWELTPNRTNWASSQLQQIPTTGTLPATAETGWAYDSVNRVIGGGVTSGLFYTFDPVTWIWTKTIMLREVQTNPSIGTVAFHTIAYNPLDNYFLFVSNSASGRHTWAYRFKKGPDTPPPPPPPPPVPPLPPTSLKVLKFATWTPATAGTPAVSYRIYNFGVEIGNTTETSFPLLLGVGDWQFTVRAVSMEGLLSEPSNAWIETVPPEN